MSTPMRPRSGPGRPAGGPGGGPRRRYVRKKFCRFCAEKDLRIDYKNVYLLKHFISERGKIVPRRISGACATHQRKLTGEIKKARIVALVPFTATQVK
ncbi:MAG: 30S ribosomal protein S18 [Deltaproteobacteria bacterium]|jgi:small subunit ribosomal protein S18|nr:30S ribosomal protein S18 [Deltaproteobacteria bacterium]